MPLPYKELNVFLTLRSKSAVSTQILIALLISALLLPACSTTRAKEKADRDAYRVIYEKSGLVPNMASDFSIDYVHAVELAGLATVAEAEDYLGEYGEAEVGCAVLSLEKAFEIAMRCSRDYQSRKESLYLQALSLTETRHRYTPVFSAGAGAAFAASTKDVSKLSGQAAFWDAAPGAITGFGGLTGASANLLQAYADLVQTTATATGANAPHTAIQQERSVSGDTSLGVNMLMKGGANIAVSLTSNFLRYLTGDPRVSTSSALIASINQPLFGQNRRTAAETLTQGERDMLYALRSFTRYRKTFAIDLASAYYRVLQSRDSVRNNWLGYQAFLKDLERVRAEADAGFKTQADLGRYEEDALQRKNSWIVAVQSYQDGLDRFKIRLGLRTDEKVVLDTGELSRLMEAGLKPRPTFTLEDATKVAFAARLDFYTERDRLDDAERKLKLAEDGLDPDIALALGGRINSRPGQDTFDELDFKRYSWNAGLDIDPKIDRLGVRNDYRRALISYDASRRQFVESEDNVRLQVREAWRTLEQARVSYEIQKNSLRLSERRVLEQELLRDMGQGNALDQIDAQNALISARNRLSAALVDHTIANLNLWLDMGILYIKEDGQWKDITDDDRSWDIPTEE
jgi:outer membrane protein TolC